MVRSFIRRIISVIITISVVLSFCACDVKTLDEQMEIGASKFVEGKETEDIVLVNNSALLEELIEKYSGSYKQPTIMSLTEDEYDDILKKYFPEFVRVPSTPTPVPTVQITPTPTPDPNSIIQAITTPEPTVSVTPEPTSTPVPTDIPTPTPLPNGMLEFDVANRQDLENAFHVAYDQTAVALTINFTNGYFADLSTEAQSVYTYLQRIDPIDASGVAQWQWWYSGNTYSIIISYDYDVDVFIQMKLDTAAEVKNLAASLNLYGKSDYEIVYEINRYICDSVYYPPQEPYAPVTHTAYGALFNGCVVCEGYACVTKLLLDEYGVVCDIECGTCWNGGGHAWNLVQIDGVWYQLDVCWNDGSSDYDDYFLVSDDYMRQSRYWEESLYPVCSKNYN